jgi:hypothetical protein
MLEGGRIFIMTGEAGLLEKKLYKPDNVPVNLWRF